MPPNQNPRNTTIFITIIVVTGVLLGILLSLKPSGNTAGIPELLEESRPLTQFTLTNHKDAPLHLDSLNNKWSFIFFGYTHCPDVCPITLSELSSTYKQISEDPSKEISEALNDTQFIFISVDPERDTPKYLADYITYFNDTFIAATGTKEQLVEITAQFGVKHSRGEKTPDGYLVNHPSAIILINPDNQYYARFKAPHYSEDIKKQYLALRKYYFSQNNSKSLSKSEKPNS